MQQSYRLRKNKQYQYVYHRGRSCACREIVLLYARSSKLQVGFSVSRKIGNSVTRNRVKRRMREAVTPLIPEIRGNVNVIFIARSAIVEAPFAEIRAAMRALLSRADLLRGNEP